MNNQCSRKPEPLTNVKPDMLQKGETKSVIQMGFQPALLFCYIGQKPANLEELDMKVRLAESKNPHLAGVTGYRTLNKSLGVLSKSVYTSIWSYEAARDRCTDYEGQHLWPAISILLPIISKTQL